MLIHGHIEKMLKWEVDTLHLGRLFVGYYVVQPTKDGPDWSAYASGGHQRLGLKSEKAARLAVEQMVIECLK